MKLTKKLMWKVVIELWEWMTETGSDCKGDWPGWEKYGNMKSRCPFCEYGFRHRKRRQSPCEFCPIDDCVNDFAFGDWADGAYTKPARKKYAGLFLAQLKEVRDK